MLDLPDIPWWTLPLVLISRLAAYSLLARRVVRGLQSPRSPILLASTVLTLGLIAGWCLLRTHLAPLQEHIPAPYRYAVSWQTWTDLSNWLAGVFLWGAAILVFGGSRVLKKADVFVYAVLGSSTSLLLSLALGSLGVSFVLDYPYWVWE